MAIFKDITENIHKNIPKNIPEYIINNTLRITVKANASKTEILSIEDNVIKIAVKAKPIDNEANLEIIKYFSKLLKKKVRIKTGLTSRNKILLIE